MDYIHIDDLDDYITQTITKVLDGAADSRIPNHITLNPQSIDFQIMVLFDTNVIETENVNVADPATDTTTDTPGATTQVQTDVKGESTRTSDTDHPSRTTVTTRSGEDAASTDRTYGEYTS